jgi:hypothetical protein
MPEIGHSRVQWLAFPRGKARGTTTADSGGMMTVLLIAVALVAAGLIVELIAAAKAPLGYQDENGFHFGREQAAKAEPFESENPS